MKLIGLNRGYEAKVDAADFDALNKYRWTACITSQGYVYAYTTMEGKRVSMHRFLCGVAGLVVDHINGETLDNRRSNLRAVSIAENNRNRKSEVRSSAGVRNVTPRKGGRFIARSSAGGEGSVYLGQYGTVEEAAQAIAAYEAAYSGKQTIPALLKRIAALESQLAARAA